jgi:hypothetical protein
VDDLLLINDGHLFCAECKEIISPGGRQRKVLQIGESEYLLSSGLDTEFPPKTRTNQTPEIVPDPNGSALTGGAKEPFPESRNKTLKNLDSLLSDDSVEPGKITLTLNARSAGFLEGSRIGNKEIKNLDEWIDIVF